MNASRYLSALYWQPCGQFFLKLRANWSPRRSPATDRRPLSKAIVQWVCTARHVGAVEYEKKRFKKIKDKTGGCDPVAIHRDFIQNKRKAGAKCVIDDDPYLALDVIDFLMDHRSAAKISKYLRDRDENPIRLYSQAIQQWICKEHNKGSIICQFIPQKARPRGVNRRNENTGIIPIPDLKSFVKKTFLTYGYMVSGRLTLPLVQTIREFCAVVLRSVRATV